MYNTFRPALGLNQSTGSQQQQFNPYQLGSLMLAGGMPQQQNMYQQQQSPYMYGPQQYPQGLQIPQGYNYDPRQTQYGMPQGGSNNPQYTYPGGVIGAGAYRPGTG